MITMILNATEIAILNRQPRQTKANGGWQSLIVGLAEKVNPVNGAITLTVTDLERIHRYAFEYRRGGWQSRLRAIFGRNLGPTLGAQLPKAA